MNARTSATIEMKPHEATRIASDAASGAFPRLFASTAHIAGVGGFVPPQTLSNADLARRVDTSDEWITERTGIEVRHIAAPGVATSDLAYEAALAALDDAAI